MTDSDHNHDHGDGLDEVLPDRDDLVSAVAEAHELVRGGEVLPDGAVHLALRIVEARKTGNPLRVKLGIDPTASDLHLGHTVCLRALRRFQEAGHQAVLVIGGFTAQVGDPTGRNATRPPLTEEEVRANAKTFLAQAGRILDLDTLEVVNNSDWLSDMNMATMMRLLSNATVNQLIAKDAFGQRIEAGQPVAVHELIYPLLQATDSVAIDADVEIGGTDQRFNILMGRQIQSQFGQKPQLALLLPLLVGTDGVRKMGKTSGNTIDIDDSPDDMFGKCMRIPDDLIVQFFRLATNASSSELAEIEQALCEGTNPKEVKEKLGYTVVREFHGVEAAIKAKDDWQRIFSQRLAPEAMPSHVVTSDTALVQLLVDTGIAPSKNRARTFITGGGVRLDQEKVTDVDHVVPVPSPDGVVLQHGRRSFVRLLPA